MLESTSNGAVLLLAVHIPDCDGTEDAEMVASEFVEIINEERDRNWDMSAPLHLPRPDGRVTVCCLPNPAFVTPGQIIDYFALVAERDRLREAVAAFAALSPQGAIDGAVFMRSVCRDLVTKQFPPQIDPNAPT